jgi:gluconate 2-dehydrogenase gamma chain
LNFKHLNKRSFTPVSPVHAKHRPAKKLSKADLKILVDIADRIFPMTDTPGALECGAVDYITIALGGDYAHYLPLYRRGVRAVDRHARRKFGAAFTALRGEQQDFVLADFETGGVSDFGKAVEFFEIIRYHVLEGVFGEPQYGGNKDMMGWRLVNFPGQQFGYPDAYINKPVDLPPVAVDDRKAQKD